MLSLPRAPRALDGKRRTRALACVLIVSECVSKCPRQVWGALKLPTQCYDEGCAKSCPGDYNLGSHTCHACARATFHALSRMRKAVFFREKQHRGKESARHTHFRMDLRRQVLRDVYGNNAGYALPIETMLGQLMAAGASVRFGQRLARVSATADGVSLGFESGLNVTASRVVLNLPRNARLPASRLSLGVREWSLETEWSGRADRRERSN